MADGQPLLVVDDDLTFASFMVDMLKRLRVRAAVAFTGSDALRQLSRSDYRGVLLDLKLPDMSGLEVLRDLRARGHLVPVVIMTGDSSVPDAVEAMQLGALNFLEKPIMLGQLAAAVEALSSYQPPSPPAPQPPSPPAPQPPSPPAPQPHLLIDQLVRAMLVVITHDEDVPTVQQWAPLAARSRSSLYALCEAIGIAPKSALDLARLLRAAGDQRRRGIRAAFLAADARTVARLLERAGMDPASSLPLRDDLLERQQLINDPWVIDRLKDHLT
jgi:DNA-binding response OmpR family regulator